MEYEGNMVQSDNANLALKSIEEALELLKNEKNCSYARQYLKQCRKTIQEELRLRALWKFEGNIPYYGG